MDEGQAIAAFWRWWTEHRDALLATVTQGLTPDLIAGLSERVDAIGEGLAWEFGHGTVAAHAFAVSAGGEAAGRLATERWRAAGPGDSADFEFHTSRQPIPRDHVMDPAIQLGEHDQLAFADIRGIVTDNAPRRRVDVELYHPAFAALPDEAVGQLLFLVLDNTVGEANVERWIGNISASMTPLDAGLDLQQLRDRVDALPTRWPPGEADWQIARGTLPAGQEVVLTLDSGLKRWNHPHLTTWCTVDLPYADRGDGMPEDFDVLKALKADAAALIRQLGAQAVHVGQQTGQGALRVLLYVDPEAVEVVDAWRRSRASPTRVHTQSDPSWDQRPQL